MKLLQKIHDGWTQSPRVQMFLAKHFTLGFMDDFKAILKIATPLLLCNLSQVFFPMISLFFCGHLGQNEFDGVSIGFTLINVFGLSFVYGLLSACDTLFPQIYGGPNKKLLGLFLQKSLIIQIISCIPVIGLLFNSRNVMLLMVEEKKIAFIAYDYIKYYLPSILFVNVANVLIKYVQSQNIVNPLMVINLCVLALNALLHYLFIFVFKMGVIGAAIAVDISCFMLMVIIFAYTHYKKLYEATWTGWTIDCLYDWKIYLKLAIPGFLALLIEWTNFEVGTVTSSTINDVELGAMSICQQVLYICFQFPFSIATAGNIHVGQLLGSNSPHKAKNAAKVLLVISVSVSLILSALVAAMSPVLPYVFTNDAEIVGKTKSLLLFCALVHLFDGGQGILAGILRTVGAQLFASVSIFVCFYIIGTPGGVVMSLKTPLLTYGFFIGVIIGCTALMGSQVYYILRIDWIKTAQAAFDLSKTEEVDLMRKISLIPTGEPVKIELSLVNPNYEKNGPESLKGSDSTDISSFDDESCSSQKSGLIEPKSDYLKADSLAIVLLKRLAAVTVLVCIFLGLFFMRNLNKYEESPISFANTTTLTTDPSQLQRSFNDYLMIKNFYRLIN